MSESELIISFKARADGVCGVCGAQVPDESLNRFYCSVYCCMRAFKHFHPPKDDEHTYD
jgi:hypothetical protein